MAAYMLIFSGEIRRRSKKPKVFKVLTSNHKLLTAVWRLQLTLQTWTQNSLVTQWPNGYLCIGQEGRLASLLKVTGSRDKMICYAHGAVLTSSILPDCLTLSPFKSFPTAFQAHFPYKHHQTVDIIREICESHFRSSCGTRIGSSILINLQCDSKRPPCCGYFLLDPSVFRLWRKLRHATHANAPEYAFWSVNKLKTFRNRCHSITARAFCCVLEE